MAAAIAAVCVASVDTALVETYWEAMVDLTALVVSGRASAVAVLARFGATARGDPILEVGKQLGRSLRAAFLADYLVNASFRKELRRVPNRDEMVNALKRASYIARVSPAQAKPHDEMRAVLNG